MNRSFQNENRYASVNWVFYVIAALYLALFYPFAFFRHDDWLILGNSTVDMVRDWGFLFRPTLYFLEQEHAWFFRPLFKLGVFLSYHAFGFQYYLWLSTLFVMTAGSVWLLYKIIIHLTSDHGWAKLFASTFTVALYAHFGSLVWAGEGMMNCPQLLFMLASTYLFLKAFHSHRAWFLSLSLLSYALALGCKESSVFHFGFLVLIVVLEPRLRDSLLRQRLLALVPFTVVTFFYLFVRLYLMPINPAYIPTYANAQLLTSLTKMVLPLMTLFLSMALMVWQKGLLSNVRRTHLLGVLYLGAITVSLVPHLGHPFFSPGWLIVPSAYLVLFFALASFPFAGRVKTLPIASRVVWGHLIVSFAVILALLQHLQWWQWKNGQKQIKDIVAQAPADTVSNMVVFDCSDPSHPSDLSRVIGFEASLYQMWQVHHDKAISVSVKRCHEPRDQRREDLVLRWEFPNIRVVHREHDVPEAHL